MRKVELNTERLTLRSVLLSDLDEVHALHSSPAVDEYNTLGIPENIKQTRDLLCEWVLSSEKEEGRKLTLAVLNEDKAFIGLIAINTGRAVYQSAEVWFKYHKKFWNKGYATEALKAVIDFGFDQLKLHRIEAGCAVENIRSKKVLEKAGMVQEGRKRKCLPLGDHWSDTLEFGMLTTDRK
ncbi:Protein N-acetyltransferase, RimJ/RimL family [Lishizhenia tianjinensis]|uniref:Protein N-acetyltransferase, RimJ/RimL family n=1 Tax=Lishizhenia tianjinensis TaxID=477690 RepID=A0A1I7AEQ2_9FLAO|nr:GNAT family N-acetyltransferase [Lishizhenia tianjinensis]SFT73375.1 Protein N-acetyltransferase, RimJ/RimL family [Lishizhenia tianjinensis]